MTELLHCTTLEKKVLCGRRKGRRDSARYQQWKGRDHFQPGLIMTRCGILDVEGKIGCQQAKMKCRRTGLSQDGEGERNGVFFK